MRKVVVLKLMPTKMKNTWLLLLLLTVCCFACQQKKTAETDDTEETPKTAELRKKVIDVHDEAMPLMSTIFELKSKLKEGLDTARALDGDKKKQVEEVILKLDSANQGMRIWMREFSKIKTTGITEEEATTILNLQMEKIVKVKKDMVESIKIAEEIDLK
jgi:hypothetical protein